MCQYVNEMKFNKSESIHYTNSGCQVAVTWGIAVFVGLGISQKCCRVGTNPIKCMKIDRNFK